MCSRSYEVGCKHASTHYNSKYPQEERPPPTHRPPLTRHPQLTSLTWFVVIIWEEVIQRFLGGISVFVLLCNQPRTVLVSQIL